MSDLQVNMLTKAGDRECTIKIRTAHDVPDELLIQLGKMLGSAYETWRSGILLHAERK